MNRAERIHHDKRIKHKVAHYWNARPGGERKVGIVARTRQMCSCLMCGNPARIEGNKIKYRCLSQRRLFEGWNG